MKKLWVLFKSYEECWYFCSRQLTWLGSGYMFSPTFCRLWVSVQFSNPSWYHSHPSCVCVILWSICDLDSGLFVNSVVRTFDMLVRIRPIHAKPRSPSIYKYLCVAFLNLSPKHFWVPWSFPFHSSGQKQEVCYPMLSCTSLTACTRGQLTGG